MKKIISFVLAAAMLLAVVAGCGNIVYIEHKFKDGVLTLSGNGAVRSSDYDAGYTITEIIILDGITGIEKEAFRDLHELTKVTVPATVKTIGDYAFLGCDKLAEVNISNAEGGVTVGKQAFPDNVTVNWLPAAGESSDTAVAAAPSDSTDAPEASTEGATDELPTAKPAESASTKAPSPDATEAESTSPEPAVTEPPHAHSFDSGVVTKEATHTSEGVKTYQCACGASYTQSIAKTTAHNYANPKITKAATHTAEGVRTYYCACGATKTEVIAKTTAHDYTLSMITKEATTTSTGVRTYYCACGATKTETIPKLESSIKVGDTIEFGRYEQDNNTRNGAETIEWRVLAVEYGKALIISEYGLDSKPYNETYTDVTWETCTLRKWLNNDFYNSAFSTEEKSRIKSTTVVNNDNPSYGTDGGNNTVDKIFLLSLEEAEKYFADDDARMMEGTAYAKANGLYVYDGNGNSWWWLRSPGNRQGDAACVDYYGWLREGGSSVFYTYSAVRPALWINL